MIRFSLAIDDYFPETDIYGRISRACQMGYSGIELLRGTRLVEAGRLLEESQKYHMEITNISPDGEQRSALNQPYGQIKEATAGAIAFAKKVQAKYVNMKFGKIAPYQTEAYHCIEDNLCRLDEEACKHSVLLAVDPMSAMTHNREGYVNSLEKGIEMIRRLNLSSTKLIYDFYAVFSVVGTNIIDISGIEEIIAGISFSGIPDGKNTANMLYRNSARNVLYISEQSEREIIVSMKYAMELPGQQSPGGGIDSLKMLVKAGG